MQETRSRILSILKAKGACSVDQIVDELNSIQGPITHVTVRHHLARLLSEGIVASEPMSRSTPGRPQLLYKLTPHGESLFPNNFRMVVDHLICHLKDSLPADQVNVIFEGLGHRLASSAPMMAQTMPERLNQVVLYLNQLGYDATWEAQADGYLLHTYNCPYHRIDHDGSTLCRMDMAMLSTMLGVVPRLARRMTDGDSSCSYFIPRPE